MPLRSVSASSGGRFRNMTVRAVWVETKFVKAFYAEITLEDYRKWGMGEKQTPYWFMLE